MTGLQLEVTLDDKAITSAARWLAVNAFPTREGMNRGKGIPVILDGLKPTPEPKSPPAPPVASLPHDQRPKVFDQIRQADEHWTKISQPIFEQWSQNEKKCAGGLQYACGSGDKPMSAR